MSNCYDVDDVKLTSNDYHKKKSRLHDEVAWCNQK